MLVVAVKGTWKNPQTKKEASILVLGFNPVRSAFNLPEVNQNLSLIRYPDTLLFERGSNGEYETAIAQIAQGNPVTTELQGRRIMVKGLYQVGASFLADGSVITSDQNFLRIFSSRKAGEVSMGLITLKPGSDATHVAARLRTQLPNDMKVFTRQAFVAAERTELETNTSIGFIFSLGVVIGFVVGAIIVYQILYSDVSDHLAEYAMLKAMGYTNLYLLGVVFQEAIILAVFGCFPGCLISVGLYVITSNATSLPLVMTSDRVLYVLVLTIIMCVSSGAIAVQKLRLTAYHTTRVRKTLLSGLVTNLLSFGAGELASEVIDGYNEPAPVPDINFYRWANHEPRRLVFVPDGCSGNYSTPVGNQQARASCVITGTTSITLPGETDIRAGLLTIEYVEQAKSGNYYL